MKLSFLTMAVAGCLSVITLSCTGYRERPAFVPDTGQIEQSIDVVKSLAAATDRSIPRDILKNAQALAVLPGIPQAAFGTGGWLGKGVITIRKAESSWSSPAFIAGRGGGSFGVPLEVESIDLVLVFRIPQSVLEVECGKLDLGAVAAGPIGGPDSVRTSVRSGSEILSYVRIKGAFAGAILGGGVRLVVDSVANEAFYRSNSVRLIFKDRVPVVPAAAVRFVRTVTEATRPGPLADTDEIPR